jgi:hypothetical protein
MLTGRCGTNGALLGVRPEVLLIALFSPARSMADGVIFPSEAHAIAAPAATFSKRKVAGSLNTLALARSLPA